MNAPSWHDTYLSTGTILSYLYLYGIGCDLAVGSYSTRQENPCLYGTYGFITIFPKVCHWILALKRDEKCVQNFGRKT